MPPVMAGAPAGSSVGSDWLFQARRAQGFLTILLAPVCDVSMHDVNKNDFMLSTAQPIQSLPRCGYGVGPQPPL